MLRVCMVIGIFLFSACLYGQSKSTLVLTGEYSTEDSLQIIEAYSKASLAVQRMNRGMNEIWDVVSDSGRFKAEIRSQRWRDDPAFMEWLGQPSNIRAVKKRISRIHSRFSGKLILEVKKDNKGRCTGWISAWTIPFGKVRIRLCEDFFVYRTHLQEKVIVHELGHEIGILFHRKVHGCRAARRAANTEQGKIAKKSTENYAWLAVSYLGISCSSR